jgi:hypothetical protein
MIIENMKKNQMRETELKGREKRNLEDQVKHLNDLSGKFELFNDRLAAQYARAQDLKVYRFTFLTRFIFILSEFSIVGVTWEGSLRDGGWEGNYISSVRFAKRKQRHLSLYIGSKCMLI